MSLEILETTQLGTMVTEYPGTSRVLIRNGLDFCCGGKQTLADACRKHGLAITPLLEALQEHAASKATSTSWMDVPLDKLIDHIVEVYHKPLPEDLEQLQAMAAKVERVHGDKDPERLGALASTVRNLADDLLPHMVKEEQILFPWIRSGRQPAPGAPIRVMEMEHDAVGQMLEEIRALTDDFQPPEGACATWRTLYARLEQLDLSLRQHIHLENNVLHPRALAALGARPGQGG